MSNEITTPLTPIQLAVAAQCEIYRDHARPSESPDKLTRGEMAALSELRNTNAQEAGVELTTVIGAAQMWMHKHEPKVMKKLMASAGLLPLATPRVQLAQLH
jgi:hypothetical protein